MKDVFLNSLIFKENRFKIKALILITYHAMMVHGSNTILKVKTMPEKRMTQELEGIDALFFKMRIACANYKRFLFLLIPFFLLALFVIFKISLRASHTQQDFLVVKKAYTQWESSQNFDSNVLQTLKGWVKKRPELVVPYEARIVQRLLAFGQIGEVHPLVDHVLTRAAQHGSTYYTQFAKTTLLIETATKSADLEKALQTSLALKQAMIADEQFWEGQKMPGFGSLLFAFNLLRIALVSKALGKTEEELVAWRDLKGYARWGAQEEDKETRYMDKGAFQQLASHFAEGGVSLQDYIKYRESAILALQKAV